MQANEHYGGMNGNVNAAKYCFMMFTCFTWGILAWVYGRKISAQLKSGNRKKTPEQKRIKKYCYTCASLMAMGFFWRMAFLPVKIGNTIQQIPPCDFSYFSLLNVMLFIVQYGCLYAQQPGKKKYTTRAYEAVKSTVMSTSSKSRKSTNRTEDSRGSSKGSKNSGFLSKWGISSGGSSTNSSYNSSAASSGGSSSAGGKASSTDTSSVDSSSSDQSQFKSSVVSGKSSAVHPSDFESGASGASDFESGASGVSSVSGASGADSAVESVMESEYDEGESGFDESEMESQMESEMEGGESEYDNIDDEDDE